MTTHTTPNYGIAYVDADTALVDLATASQQAAQTIDAALGRGGIAPVDATSLATEAATRRDADTALDGRATSLEASRTAVEGAWTTYTPTWTVAGTVPPALGNGTLVGRYRKQGRTVNLFLRLSPGSTTTGGTQGFRFSLPAPAAQQSYLTAKAFVGGAIWGGVGEAVGSLLTPLFPPSATDVRLQAAQNASSGNTAGTGIPAVSGAFSYITGSDLYIVGTYEAAA